MSTDNSQNTDGHEPDARSKMTAKTYLKFAAMILTGMAESVKAGETDSVRRSV